MYQQTTQLRSPIGPHNFFSGERTHCDQRHQLWHQRVMSCTNSGGLNIGLYEVCTFLIALFNSQTTLLIVRIHSKILSLTQSHHICSCSIFRELPVWSVMRNTISLMLLQLLLFCWLLAWEIVQRSAITSITTEIEPANIKRTFWTRNYSKKGEQPVDEAYEQKPISCLLNLFWKFLLSCF